MPCSADEPPGKRGPVASMRLMASLLARSRDPSCRRRRHVVMQVMPSLRHEAHRWQRGVSDSSATSVTAMKSAMRAWRDIVLDALLACAYASECVSRSRYRPLDWCHGTGATTASIITCSPRRCSLQQFHGVRPDWLLDSSSNTYRPCGSAKAIAAALGNCCATSCKQYCDISSNPSGWRRNGLWHQA